MPDPSASAQPVRVLLDRQDDARVSVGLLERHHPAGGLVVVHPTPGVSNLAAAAHDVLAALGRAVNRLAAERLVGDRQAWHAVASWLVSGRIMDLVVLRADRLGAPVWNRLLQVCRQTGTRLLLVCHVPAIPPVSRVALAGIDHQVLTDHEQLLACWPRRNHRGDIHRSSDPATVVDLPSYPYGNVRNYRLQAPARIGLTGFLQTDVVYQHGRAAALGWLSSYAASAGQVFDIAAVQLFLTALVQDSPTRNHTLARLRGAQAGFRLRCFDLQIPSPQRILAGELPGPGLGRGGGLDADTVDRILAGVAHPVIAAGIAVSLLTDLPVLFLHSLPREALSADNDVLRLTWFPHSASLVCSTVKDHVSVPVTAVFPVPPAMRPLLQAARYYAPPGDGSGGQRLFASTTFTYERIAPAAANCAITLPDQRQDRHADLSRTWQSQVTCTPTSHLGGQFDTGFAQDQAFSPIPVH